MFVFLNKLNIIMKDKSAIKQGFFWTKGHLPTELDWTWLIFLIMFKSMAPEVSLSNIAFLHKHILYSDEVSHMKAI